MKSYGPSYRRAALLRSLVLSTGVRPHLACALALVWACSDRESRDAIADAPTVAPDQEAASTPSDASNDEGGRAASDSEGGSAARDASSRSGDDDAGDAAPPANCGYGLGTVTSSTRIDSLESALDTDATRPDTAEVYCVAPTRSDRRSVVLVPGLGLSHYLYLTTPDRRTGWAQGFADHGYVAHVVNPRGNRKPASAVQPNDPLRVWTEAEFWSRWGFGPMPRESYSDVRFPVAHVDDFIAHLPAYGGPGGGADATSPSPDAVAEVLEVLERVGPSVLVLHSASGPNGFEVARTNPELVRALVVLEPTGCPTTLKDTPDLPFLAVWGDRIAARGQGSRMSACETTRDLVSSRGAKADVFSYPERNVHGNTHLLMQDNNNEVILRDVLGWLETIAAP